MQLDYVTSSANNGSAVMDMVDSVVVKVAQNSAVFYVTRHSKTNFMSLKLTLYFNLIT